MDPKDLDKIARRLASGDSGRVRTAGKIEFVKDSGPVRRDVRVEGFQWTPDALRNLAKILWAAQRSHSYAIAAYRLFSKMPSSQFSPDGLLGGRGYIQSVKDMRQALALAVETMSSFTDTVHDEVNADHWKESGGEEGQVSDMVDQAAAVKANPEQFVEGQFQDEEHEPFDPSSAAQVSEVMEEADAPVENPTPADFGEGEFEEEEEENEEEDDDEDEDDFFSQVASEAFADAKDLKGLKGRRMEEPDEPASQLPGATGDQSQGKSAPEMTMNTTSPDKGSYASAISRILKAHEQAHARTAAVAGGSSSLPLETMPGGPFVEHVGPGSSDTESGGYGDGWGSDDPSGDALAPGTNMTQPLYEDWTMDGVTGDDNPTDGDETVLKVSSRVAAGAVGESYSWLPGSSNDRNLNYYELGLSEKDTEWMRQNAAPALPPGIKAPEKKFDSRTLWEVDF